MTDLDKIDTEPDWTPWEDETVHGYLWRMVSQAVWQAGQYADENGDGDACEKLWRFADTLLDYAYPPPPPTEIDLAADQ